MAKVRFTETALRKLSKFGKLSSDHRTGKGQFSFQSQRKAMPKNAQTIALISHASKVMSLLFNMLSRSLSILWHCLS